MGFSKKKDRGKRDTSLLKIHYDLDTDGGWVVYPGDLIGVLGIWATVIEVNKEEKYVVVQRFYETGEK